MSLHLCNSTVGSYLDTQIARYNRRRYEEEMMLKSRRYGMPRFEPSILEFGCDFSNKVETTFKGLFNCIEQATKTPDNEQEVTREELFLERDILNAALDSAHEELNKKDNEINSLKLTIDCRTEDVKHYKKRIEEIESNHSRQIKASSEEIERLRNANKYSEERINNILTQLINK